MSSSQVLISHWKYLSWLVKLSLELNTAMIAFMLCVLIPQYKVKKKNFKQKVFQEFVLERVVQ